jgi:hypothetical protein
MLKLRIAVASTAASEAIYQGHRLQLVRIFMIMIFKAVVACRHFFLDAVLLMRDRPREHLLRAWAGILQQRQEDDGEQHPVLLAQLQFKVTAMWTACAGAALLSCFNPSGAHYSRCTMMLMSFEFGCTTCDGL